MRKRILTIILILVIVQLTAGCTKKVVTASVPGSINALDAYAYRVTSDAQASIHSIKTWQQCSAANFPATVNVDNTTESCDASAGKFPDVGKPALNAAINAYNIAQASGKAYHSGASNDGTELQNALNQLSQAITGMLTKTGGK